MPKKLRAILYTTAAMSGAMAAAIPATAFADDVITVTATRRSESIQDTPLAVSAFSGEDLQEAQINSLQDLIVSNPNIQFAYSTTNANITIRGIGNTQSQAGADAGVALHVDGVYLGESGIGMMSFMDLNRVEVLRGPQGTLFGRNATGGAINLIPNTPTEELDFGVDASAGFDPTLLKGSAFVSGPILSSGKLLGRVSLQNTFKKGDTENLSPDGPALQDGIESFGARAQLEWRPSDTFSARALIEQQEQHDNGRAIYLAGRPDETQPLLPILVGQPTGDVENDTVYANVGYKDISATTANLHLNWELGGGNLKAIVSYIDSYQDVLQDGDATPALHTTTKFENITDQIFSEIIYSSDASGPFSYIIGANIFSQDLTQNVSVPISGFPMPVNLGGTVDTFSYAAFLHADYEFLPGATLFGGVRYTDDKKEVSDYNNYVGTSMREASWDRVTYDVGLSYEFSPAVSGYVKYATGYKGGGYSAGGLSAAFNPEIAKNYEIGLKGDYFDGVLSANLAGFYMKYQDLQVNQVIGVLAAVTNAAEATVKGVEAEVVLSPTEALRVNFSGSWLDATFDEFMTEDSARPTLGVLDLSGNRLPLAPKFSTSVGVYYDMPTSHGVYTAGARYDWRSEVAFSSFNIPVSSQDEIGKLDLSFRYTSANEKWTASIYALNVTDEKVLSANSVVSALIGSLSLNQYQPGRQVGFSIGYHY